MPALRIGLIGCGHMGRIVHLNTLLRFKSVKVVALAEPDAQRREAANAQAPKAAPYADYKELLEREDIDAVIIALPNALHAAATINALDCGKHVYLEKPLAINIEDGGKIVEVWRRSGRVGMIGFNYRFNPLHQQVRRHLQAGLLGELIGARSVFTATPRRAPEWKQTRQTGGGVLLDLASHHIDLVRFWFNEPVLEVSASIKSQRVEADSATVELRLANGFPVQSFFSMSSVDDDRFEIYGRSGKLVVDRYGAWTVGLTDLRSVSLARRYLGHLLTWLPRSRFAVDKLLAPEREPSFAAALAQFVAAARMSEPTSPNFEDGFYSLATVIAAEESARTGHPVRVSRPPE